MDLILFILICYGASNIMVFSTIFEKWRNFFDKYVPFLGQLFTCMICLPFWWGVLLSLMVYSPSVITFNMDSIILGSFIDGCLASGGVWLVHSLQEKLERDG